MSTTNSTQTWYHFVFILPGIHSLDPHAADADIDGVTDSSKQTQKQGSLV